MDNICAPLKPLDDCNDFLSAMLHGDGGGYDDIRRVSLRYAASALFCDIARHKQLENTNKRTASGKCRILEI